MGQFNRASLATTDFHEIPNLLCGAVLLFSRAARRRPQEDAMIGKE